MLPCKKTPCPNCPYRTDAPIKKWHMEEFVKVLEAEKEPLMGKIFDCHKKDGKLCTGYVMLQDRRNIPAIQLRIRFSKDQTSVAELDTLFCSVELFPSPKAMAYANYPRLEAIYGPDVPYVEDED